jgi:ubiquinone/menaquinone biosynthesis C-methylase UbiE
LTVADYDDIAEHYDATRGGEDRGAEYAAFLDGLIPSGGEPICEIGVGTGVVALGLRRRGRRVIGIDLSLPMLFRAHSRLGPVVVASDAQAMSIASASIRCAVSVWFVHAVSRPTQLFREAARILRHDGSYVVSATQDFAPDDRVGAIINDMAVRVDERRGALRSRSVTTDEVIGWAEEAGFVVDSTHQLRREWHSTPSKELDAIAQRAWPAMRDLDEEDLAEALQPIIEALQGLPKNDSVRRATAEVVVFRKA